MMPPSRAEHGRLVLSGSILVLCAVVTAIGAPPAAASPATVRQDLAQILDVYQEIGARYDLEDVRATAEGARLELARSSDDAMRPLARSEASVARLRELADRIASVILPPVGPPESSTPGLPGAPYTGLCGDDRPEPDVLLDSQEALFIAEGVREQASRGCDEVVVLLGEGGNTSLLCIITDAVFIVAKGLHEGLVFCQDDIDAAEIEGSYERLGHIHADIEDHVAQLAKHDREINARLDQIDQALADIICLLKTPEGRRPGWNEECEISGGFTMLPGRLGELAEAIADGASTAGTTDMRALPVQCELGPIVPSPFNPATTIHFALAGAGDVQLSVYDTAGRLVRILVDGALSAGYHQVEFDGRSLASGTYVAQLVTPERTLSSKMLLLK